MLVVDRDIRCRIRQTAHTEGELSHLLRASCVRGDDGNGGILANLRRTGDVLAWAYGLQGAIGHRGLDLGEGHTRHTDADGVVITRIEHIHQIGTDGGTGIDDGVLLREVTTHFLTITIDGLQITSQGEVACGATDALIEIVFEIHLLITYIDIRHLRGVDSSHDDMGGELVTTDDGLGVGDDEGLEGIDADILHVDVLHQGMEHLTLGITHIAL